MQLTPQRVEEVCGRIERALAAFADDVKHVARLHEAWRLLQWLREQYHENRSVLDGCLDRLKGYRERLRASVRACRDALAAEYIRAGRAVLAWRDRQGACRDLLIELAMLENVDRFDSAEGPIDVRHTRHLALPPAETQERKELLALIDASGRWQDVAAIHPTRLLHAMDGGLFPPDQVGRIAKLCPVRATCRLLTRQQGR